MTLLRNLTLSVCILSLVHTVLIMLVPDRFRGEIRSVTALIIAVTVAGFMLNADFSDIPSGLGMQDFDSALETRNDLVKSELEAKVGEYIVSLLGQQGIESEKVSVRTTIDGQNSIFITEVSITLSQNDSPREESVRALVRDRIGDVDVEILYGDN